jgi:hypothetical protein
LWFYFYFYVFTYIISRTLWMRQNLPFPPFYSYVPPFPELTAQHRESCIFPVHVF